MDFHNEKCQVVVLVVEDKFLTSNQSKTLTKKQMLKPHLNVAGLEGAKRRNTRNVEFFEKS
jgi:hypothetical protein